MRRKKKRLRRAFIGLFSLAIIGAGGYGYYTLEKSIPDEIKVLVGSDESFDFNIPIIGKMDTQDVYVVNSNENLKVPANQIDIDLNKPFTINSSKQGNYSIKLKLFGLFEVKNVSLDVIEQIELIPCGIPIGIHVDTDGILVLGSGKITGEDNLNYEPIQNKLKSGDYILSINNRAISKKSDLIEEIQNCEGKDISLGVRRNDEIITVNISPVKTASGEYKIGAWIRDNTQGIGTMTFMTTAGQFGALGHGITDIDTGVLMAVKQGVIYNADIMSIVKGKDGEPGELIGMIKQSNNNKIGEILVNSYQGIFGRISNHVNTNAYGKPYEIGLKQEIEEGKATILCTLENQIESFEIEIESVDISKSNNSKGMVIRITDERLLDKTGGIVQGMSGSPILQNGKIIGAVTHVFIQDSTKGYGTFIENMVNNLE